mmetsp:Transcript_54399/g.174432  ORF Transcript_54399/g.174432 Transcript_54399/m.174432 type:complete len:156 (-) Transcript_54399:64-531(-)
MAAVPEEREGTAASLQLPCCSRRLVLRNGALFLQKALVTIVASYALLPVLAAKATLPAVVYVVVLIVIHLVVLSVYLYRVSFLGLDVDWSSLLVRLVALAGMLWLLSRTVHWMDHDHMGKLAWQIGVLCLLHLVILAVLMVRVERTDEEAKALVA